MKAPYIMSHLGLDAIVTYDNGADCLFARVIGDKSVFVTGVSITELRDKLEVIAKGIPAKPIEDIIKEFSKQPLQFYLDDIVGQQLPDIVGQQLDLLNRASQQTVKDFDRVRTRHTKLEAKVSEMNASFGRIKFAFNSVVKENTSNTKTIRQILQDQKILSIWFTVVGGFLIVAVIMLFFLIFNK